MGFGALKRTDTERSARPGQEYYRQQKIGYNLVKKIGEGGQGKTEIVKRQGDGKVFVRKEQKHFETIRTREGKMPMEMYIFENIIGPVSPYSIVKFDHCNYTAAGLQTLYFEYCDGGDLDHFVKKGMSERHIWECFIQLADALAYLHYGLRPGHKTPPSNWKKIVHRDLKPANVFLRRKPVPGVKWEFVLGDFGLATTETETSGCGTGEWIGPEIPEMTSKGDVWSLGAIIHALCHGKSPCDPPPRSWRGKSSEWYWSPKARHARPLTTDFSSALNEQMFHCLEDNPRDRYPSWELVKSLERAQRDGYN